ncbi:MAG: 3-methyl-2-oxobutanoate dehydrogenase subunit beta, partial [Chloroflexi bacterium]
YVMRGGPGLGNIAPAQSDYNQIGHGGGHGDYHTIVLAPASVQEAIDLTTLAFDLAEKYRSIAVVLLDGSLGQMMEPAELPEMGPVSTTFPAWAASGAMGRKPNALSSIYLNPPDEEAANLRMLQRWQEVEANEVRYKEYFMEDARYVVVGFGSAGRVALSAVRAARAEGIPVGLLRPITLSPFPGEVVTRLGEQAEAMLVVEMNAGQMLEDVRLATKGSVPIEFYGRLGGVVPFPDEVLSAIRSLAQGNYSLSGHPRDRWLKQMVEAHQAWSN